MATKLDRSEHSGVLVTCTDCEYWFAFAWTVAKAHDSACNHDELVHPGRFTAHVRRSQYKLRHAD